MTAEPETAVNEANASESQFQVVTFYVDGLLLGLKVDDVREINRQVNVTAVPHAPPLVRGVINLRGEVTTIIDLRTVLGLSAESDEGRGRILVVRWEEESIGLCVDEMADILTLEADSIDAPPANIRGVSGRFFQGVFTMESEILVLLDLDACLACDTAPAA